MAVSSTAGIRPSQRRSSQSQSGLSKKLSNTASVKGTSSPLARYKAAMTTAIDASVNIHEGLAFSFGSAIRFSRLRCASHCALPDLQFPPQDEANTYAPERDDFRSLAGVLSKVFEQVGR